MTSRRACLAAAVAFLVSGCGREASDSPTSAPVTDGEQHCRTPGELVSFEHVGTGQLLYDESGAATSMQIEPKFLAQVNAWSQDWTELSGLGAIRSVTSYGAYVDKCNSYHQIGQAFDLTRIEHDSRTISLHYDTWRPGSAQQLRDYWRVAASLHLHFSYTLAYPYNDQHLNHIHIDNLVSGGGLSTFDATSHTQLNMVQYGCRYIFDQPVEATGNYDEQTKQGVRFVQRQAGITVPLAEPDGWRSFLRALARG